MKNEENKKNGSYISDQMEEQSWSADYGQVQVFQAKKQLKNNK